MGTWCRIFIRYKSKFILGQCGKGGYIDEQGIYLLNFLRSRRNILRLKEGLEHIEYIKDDEASEWKWKIDKKLGGNVALQNDWMSFCENVDTSLPRELQDMNTSLHPCTGAAILKLISDSTAKQKVQLVKELHCTNSFDEEWHYVVDLDRSRLEVYHGLELPHPDHIFRVLDRKGIYRVSQKKSQRWTNIGIHAQPFPIQDPKAAETEEVQTNEDQKKTNFVKAALR
ncbi:uncharacterized protein FRV6_16503 [Fusarium oxysporum]|uniref:Uncharacterized protein n=1 Tax=Fusarium oxysporum TaxID=5507 RepID=A0A2H3TXL6_FUSOX|nr:uncharacterized protein FRV6_16503 [Fusarium oxysporum]